jgi:outer membrane protein assembly factor BamB
MIDSTGYIFVLSMNGELLSKWEYGIEFWEIWPGSRSSVTIVGDLLYIESGHGVLFCMSALDGTIKWKKGLFTDFDGKNITWGVTETVVVDGDVLYCTPGGVRNNMVALNRFNGNIIWSSAGKGELSGYCTPLLINLPTRKLVVTHTANSIIGIDASNGKLLWSRPQTNEWSVHANTPVYQDGRVFCFSGYGQGGPLLKLSADGSSVKEEWFAKTFDSRMGGAVLVNGYLYGSGDESGKEWQCLDWKTGQVKYKSTAATKGVVIYADGMLIGYSWKGELFIAPASPDDLKITGKTKITLGSDQHWAHPVLNDGILYVRHGTSIMAFKVK